MHAYIFNKNHQKGNSRASSCHGIARLFISYDIFTNHCCFGLPLPPSRRRYYFCISITYTRWVTHIFIILQKRCVEWVMMTPISLSVAAGSLTNSFLFNLAQPCLLLLFFSCLLTWILNINHSHHAMPPPPPPIHYKFESENA